MATDKNKKKSLDAEITNALLDDFDKFEHFVVTYWKQIGAVAVAIVVVVALYVMVANDRKEAERKINNIICNAKTEAEILEVLQQYPGHPAADYARLRLAKDYLKEKKYAQAYEQFKMLLASDIPLEMTWQIRLDEAYALELEGKTEEAAVKFADIGSSSSFPDLLRREADYSAGRLYLVLKQDDKARKYLERAGLKKGVSSREAKIWMSQANFLLATLAEPEAKAVAVKPKAATAPIKKPVETVPAPKAPGN